MRRPRLVALAVLAALLGACGDPSSPRAPAGPSADLLRLVSWMTGSFGSAKQAAEDPEYRDIRLHMAPVWKDRTDGPWLYVEQAMAQAPDRPYRQRVYRVRETAPGVFESRVYELPEPAKAVGAWKDAAPLADLEPAALLAREGCAVVLRKVDDRRFAGSTEGDACKSAFQGAAYATSEVTITAEGLVSWDRGYDAAGTQVWGATKGGYRFDRLPD